MFYSRNRVLHLRHSPAFVHPPTHNQGPYMTRHSKTLSVVRRVARQETPLLVRLSRRLDLHYPLLDASTGQAEARVLTTHPSSCTPPTTSRARRGAHGPR